MKELKLFQQAQFKLMNIDSMTDEHTSEEPNAVVVLPSPTEVYIEGYATVFIDSNGERLVDRESQSVNLDFLNINSYLSNPVLNYNHDFNKVVGRVLSVVKDSKGLFVRAVVHKLSGQEYVFELVQKGLLRAFSIGFIVKKQSYLDDNTVEVSEAELIEISLAGTQANQEALFRVIGQKSMSVSKKLLAEQNHMSCNELDGMCSLQTKGLEMETNIIVEPKIEPAVVAPVVAVIEEQKVVEPKPAMNEAALVEAITNAQLKAEQIKADKLAEVEAQVKADADAKIKAESDRIASATNYIKEQTAMFLNTPDADIDLDSVEAFYELISGSAEAIESKVASAVKASLKSA